MGVIVNEEFTEKRICSINDKSAIEFIMFGSQAPDISDSVAWLK